MTVYSILAMVGSTLDLLCIIIVIFVERKNPSSTIAWALVLIFLPFVGFIAYVMFGSGFHVKKKKRYAIKLIADNMHRRNIAKHIHGHVDTPPQSDRPHGRLISYLENDGAHFLTGDNAAIVFTDGRDMFDRMKEDMREAKTHIHLLYYIFRNDVLGREILDILTEKARSGVDVRIIYDSLGSLLSRGSMFKKLRQAGGQIVAFSPLVFSLSSHLRLNYRNHRKITVIDGAIGYLGGMNVGEEYLGANPRLSPWRDTHLRLTGSSVTFLEERFLLDWTSATDQPLRNDQIRSFMPRPLVRGNLNVQIASSGPDTATSTLKNGLLEMLYSARKNIYIQTPYFTPDDSFLDALRIAAGSGVDVRLMLPGLKDHLFVHTASLGYARQLLGTGVRLFLYNGFLHAKTLVIDGAVASIGTANLDYRSFSLNFEINAFIYNEPFAAQYEDIFRADLDNCAELDEHWFADRSPFTRAAYSATRLLAPVM